MGLGWGGSGSFIFRRGQLHWLCVLDQLLWDNCFFGVLPPPSILGAGVALLLLNVEADLAWERHHQFWVLWWPLLERGFIVVGLE